MIKIIADSTCDLTAAEAEKLGITIIPMKVLIDDEEYISGVNLTSEDFYPKLATCKRLPQTTLISAFEYEEIITNALKDGDEVFVMCISSNLSSSYQNLESVYNELKNPKLAICDTKSVTFTYGALVIEAARLAKECKTAKELKEKMQTALEKVKLLAVIDNVKYLIKGGRLSLAKGLVVTALNIKPIITLTDGKLAVVSKGIGLSNGLCNLMKEIKNIDMSKPIYFGHSNSIKNLDVFKKIFQEKYEVKESGTCIVGPVVGTHAGPGCVGIVYFEN